MFPNLLFVTLFAFPFMAGAAPVPVMKPMDWTKTFNSHTEHVFENDLGKRFACNEKELLLHEDLIGITSFDVTSKKTRVLLSDSYDDKKFQRSIQYAHFSPTGKEFYFTNTHNSELAGRALYLKNGEMVPKALLPDSINVTAFYDGLSTSTLLNFYIQEKKVMKHTYRMVPPVKGELPWEGVDSEVAGLSAHGELVVIVNHLGEILTYRKKEGAFIQDKKITEVLGPNVDESPSKKLLRTIDHVDITSNGKTILFSGIGGVSVVDGESLKKIEFIPTIEKNPTVRILEGGTHFAVYPVGPNIEIFSLATLTSVAHFSLPPKSRITNYQIQQCGKNLYLLTDPWTIHQFHP